MALIKKVARILCIDGGGIRGLIPAEIIKNWEMTLGPIAKNFHMVAGTSTGGILACALSQGVTAEKLIGFYRSQGPLIFSSNMLALGGLGGELYDASNLVSAIKSVLKGNLSSVSKDLLVTSYNIESQSPFLFKSWKARGYELDRNETPTQNDFDIVDVSRATSAAPTYFQPAQIKSKAGKTYPLIDGGVYANNPAMCAYTAARRLYPRADEYIIVSLGTGALIKPLPYSDAANFGMAGWLRPLLDIMFNGVAATTEYELSQFPGVSQYRFQTNLTGASEALDDASSSNLDNLIKCADKTAQKFAPDMAGLIHRLQTEKMSTLTELGYPTPTSIPKPVLPVTIVPKRKIVTPVTSTTAGAGAILGLKIGGPLGAALGAIGGWLVGESQSPRS